MTKTDAVIPQQNGHGDDLFANSSNKNTNDNLDMLMAEKEEEKPVLSFNELYSSGILKSPNPDVDELISTSNDVETANIENGNPTLTPEPVEIKNDDIIENEIDNTEDMAIESQTPREIEVIQKVPQANFVRATGSGLTEGGVGKENVFELDTKRTEQGEVSHYFVSYTRHYQLYIFLLAYK